MRYRFASFLLDLERYELRCGDTLIELAPRPFALLCYLVEQAPRAVPREELLERVWADVHTVEGALNQAVSQLRRSLAVVQDGADVVETVRGRGYRISVAVAVDPPSDGAPDAERSSRPTVRRAWLVAAGLALALVSTAGLLSRPPPRPERSDGPTPSASVRLNPHAGCPAAGASPSSPGPRSSRSGDPARTRARSDASSGSRTCSRAACVATLGTCA
jgi:DNA-binding winged helix-turn-helix (wHTH) protein